MNPPEWRTIAQVAIAGEVALGTVLLFAVLENRGLRRENEMAKKFVEMLSR